MQVPRYKTSAGENLTLDKSVNKVRRWFLNIITLFSKNPANIEELELNYIAQNQLSQLEDSYNEDSRAVPVTGLTDIDVDQVSMNFLDGMLKYRHGGLKQKQLLASDAFAQALVKIVNDEKNLPIETSKWSKFFLKSSFGNMFRSLKASVEKAFKRSGKKKAPGTSVRAKAVTFFYNREYRGQKIVDGTGDKPIIWRLYKFCTRLISFRAFAGNGPSAVKNRTAAILKAYMEGVGGRFMSVQSLLLGKPKAMAMMGELLAGSMYSYKTKSLNIQLMQIFNVGQEFLRHSTHRHFGRSVKEDFANLSFITSHRKFLQMEATVEMFCGMLNHVKIEQTTKYGKNEIRYVDAWELRNGQIELKPGIDPEYAPGGKKFNAKIGRAHV